MLSMSTGLAQRAMTLGINLHPGSTFEQILSVGSDPDAAELPVKVIKGEADCLLKTERQGFTEFFR